MSIVLAFFQPFARCLSKHVAVKVRGLVSVAFCMHLDSAHVERLGFGVVLQRQHVRGPRPSTSS